MYEVAKSLEAEAIPRLGPKGIFPNVDFYSGLAVSYTHLRAHETS